jgi:hypothetical protein
MSELQAIADRFEIEALRATSNPGQTATRGLRW